MKNNREAKGNIELGIIKSNASILVLKHLFTIPFSFVLVFVLGQRPRISVAV